MQWMKRLIAVTIALVSLALIAPSAYAHGRYRYRDRAPSHRGRITTAAVVGLAAGYYLGRESRRSRDRDRYHDDRDDGRRYESYRYRRERYSVPRYRGDSSS